MSERYRISVTGQVLVCGDSEESAMKILREGLKEADFDMPTLRMLVIAPAREDEKPRP